MAYDETLAARMRAYLADRDDIAEQRMFGGLAFLLGGHMCCGIHGDELIVRLGPELGPRALERPHTRVVTFTGRPMPGMIVVAPEGVVSDEAIAGWLDQAIGFTAGMPPKPVKPARAAKPARTSRTRVA